MTSAFKPFVVLNRTSKNRQVGTNPRCTLLGSCLVHVTVSSVNKTLIYPNSVGTCQETSFNYTRPSGKNDPRKTSIRDSNTGNTDKFLEKTLTLFAKCLTHIEVNRRETGLNMIFNQTELFIAFPKLRKAEIYSMEDHK